MEMYVYFALIVVGFVMEKGLGYNACILGFWAMGKMHIGVKCV